MQLVYQIFDRVDTWCAISFPWKESRNKNTSTDSYCLSSNYTGSKLLCTRTRAVASDESLIINLHLKFMISLKNMNETMIFFEKLDWFIDYHYHFCLSEFSNFIHRMTISPYFSWYCLKFISVRSIYWLFFLTIDSKYLFWLLFPFWLKITM